LQQFALGQGIPHGRLQYSVIAVVTLLIALQVWQSWKGPSDPNLRFANVSRDFKAFYCAGAATNAGENPYLIAPLKRCGAPPGVALPTYARSNWFPAPLPPYDVALFRAFALLPFRVAALLWLVLSIAALSLAVILIANISGLAPLAVFAAFALPLYYSNLEWGQLPPIVVGALALTAYGLKGRNYSLAGLASVATLLEPHLGVPVCISVFLWAPRTRLSLAGGAAFLGLTGIATLGVAANIEFFSKVLPLQVLAEVPVGNQYSLTWLVYTFGAPEDLAVRIGSASYVLMAAFGVAIAGMVARAAKAPEFLALTPPAFVVFGGAYLHLTQTSVSMLLGMLLLTIGSRVSSIIWLGVALQVPVWYAATWLTRPLTPLRIESVIAVATFAFVTLRDVSYRRRFAIAALCSFAYITVSFAILHAPNAIIREPLTDSGYARKLGTNQEYASGQWGIYVRSDSFPDRTSTAISLTQKIPVWLGLLLVIVGTTSYAADNQARENRGDKNAAISIAESPKDTAPYQRA
jgi:hypothetical protein